jgi:hypothetical protein
MASYPPRQRNLDRNRDDARLKTTIERTQKPKRVRVWEHECHTVPGFDDVRSVTFAGATIQKSVRDSMGTTQEFP